MALHEVVSQVAGRLSLGIAAALLAVGPLLQACDIALQWWAGSLAMKVGKK